MSDEKEQLEIDETNPVQAKEEEVARGIDEKKLSRKLDLHLLPGVSHLFLLSFLDRSNGPFSFLSSPSSYSLLVGNTRLEGPAADTHKYVLSLSSTLTLLTVTQIKPETSI